VFKRWSEKLDILKSAIKKTVSAYKSTYKRHGTLYLFAPLNVAKGHIKAQTTQTKTRVDFQNFMDNIMHNLPMGVAKYRIYLTQEEWGILIRISR